MSHIVGANTDSVEVRLIVDKLLMVSIEMNVVKTSVLVVLCRKLLSLTGDKVSHGNDINIVHVKIALDVSLGNPACADDAYLKSSARRSIFLFDSLSKLV